jgi:hypothetical protein
MLARIAFVTVFLLFMAGLFVVPLLVVEWVARYSPLGSVVVAAMFLAVFLVIVLGREPA